jgi:hypothetical protein
MHACIHIHIHIHAYNHLQRLLVAPRACMSVSMRIYFCAPRTCMRVTRTYMCTYVPLICAHNHLEIFLECFSALLHNLNGRGEEPFGGNCSAVCMFVCMCVCMLNHMQDCCRDGEQCQAQQAHACEHKCDTSPHMHSISRSVPDFF